MVMGELYLLKTRGTRWHMMDDFTRHQSNTPLYPGIITSYGTDYGVHTFNESLSSIGEEPN